MKTMAYGILTVMLTGLLTNALALWKNSAIVEHRVQEVEKKVETQDNKNSELERKIDEMHWYLIRSKHIAVPPKDK